MFSSDLPYNDLPNLPQMEELETKEVLKTAIRANVQLARLNVTLTSFLSPLALLDSLALEEGKYSSQLEGITTDADLYRYAAADLKSMDAVIRKVLSYKDALREGFKHVNNGGGLTTETLVEIGHAINESPSGLRTGKGKQLRNAKGDVLYTPPEEGEIVTQKLRNLEKFLSNSDDGLDPLVKMAVAHYQFLAIQPFDEGNGRVGSIMNILFLVQQGLLGAPILLLNKYIVNNEREYLQRFIEVTSEHNWQRWILYMLSAIEETSEAAYAKIKEINAAKEKMDDAIKRALPKIYSRNLIDVLFQYPYSKRQFLEDAGIAKVKTAGTYLSALEENGFLKSVDLGKEKLFGNIALLEIVKMS